VDDTAAVGDAQRFQHLLPDEHRLGGRELVLLDARHEAIPFQSRTARIEHPSPST
jgi:hypothetical protein